MAVNPDVRTWSKIKQYAWVMSILWGKMVTTIDAQTLAAQCANIYRQNGMTCPVFGESDIPQIVQMYMSLYPEHRGFEERLKWIIRCQFRGGQIPATPPAVLTLAPYLEKRQFPLSVLPEPPSTTAPGTLVLPPGQPSPESPLLGGIPGWVKYGALGLLAYYVLLRR